LSGTEPPTLQGRALGIIPTSTCVGVRVATSVDVTTGISVSVIADFWRAISNRRSGERLFLKVVGIEEVVKNPSELGWRGDVERGAGCEFNTLALAFGGGKITSAFQGGSGF
jgi:hypothetical protein